MLSGQRDSFTFAQTLLADLVPWFRREQGTIYQMAVDDDNR